MSGEATLSLPCYYEFFILGYFTYVYSKSVDICPEFNGTIAIFNTEGVNKDT